MDIDKEDLSFIEKLKDRDESIHDFISKCRKLKSNESELKSSMKLAICYLVLGAALLMAFFNRQYSVINFESIIHEFDPWFNYRATRYYVENGFYKFWNWLDETAWYPIGRIVGETVFPGLMFTSGALHKLLEFIAMPIHIQEICVFISPLFSCFTVLATYFLTKEMWNEKAGLLAALFISIVPGYISRSVAGSYDNEGIAIFLLVISFALWLKSMKTGSMFWAVVTAFFYWYLVAAWGGYVFVVNMIPLHVFTLLIMGHYSDRLYTAYCTYYILGVVLAMQIPFVGIAAVSTSEHLPSLGIFGLLQLVAFTNYTKSILSVENHKIFSRYFLNFFVVLGIALIVTFEYLGIISPLTGRFYSLFDTSYAAVHIPIISSVAEHQPTTWISYFVDLHFLPFLMVYGVYLCIMKTSDVNVFGVLYAVFGSYFSGVMIRLMLTLAPIACVMGAITLSYTLDNLMKLLYETEEPVKSSKNLKKSKLKRNRSQQFSLGSIVGIVVIFCVLAHFVKHSTHITSSHYSSPSVVFSVGSRENPSVIDDFREAYYWMNRNLDPKAKVLSWWDYGYQIAGFSNKTTIVDNNTWNNTHIATVGRAMASNESEAYKIFRKLDIDYVLVIFGGVLGYSGDDINKFLWMVRIAQGEFPQAIQETNYFTQHGYNVGEHVSETMKNSIMFKTSYYNFGRMSTHPQAPPGYDIARRYQIMAKDIKLETLEEAYTSEHWIVRIYKVKDLQNRHIYGKKNQIRV